MCLVDLSPSRGRKTLHTIIATTEQDSAEDVDHYMESGVETLDASTFSFFQDTVTLCKSSQPPHSDSEIDRENYQSPDCKVEYTESPSRKTSCVALYRCWFACSGRYFCAHAGLLGRYRGIETDVVIATGSKTMQFCCFSTGGVMIISARPNVRTNRIHNGVQRAHSHAAVMDEVVLGEEAF
jgi:hypothetical protein